MENKICKYNDAIDALLSLFPEGDSNTKDGVIVVASDSETGAASLSILGSQETIRQMFASLYSEDKSIREIIDTVVHTYRLIEIFESKNMIGDAKMQQMFKDMIDKARHN